MDSIWTFIKGMTLWNWLSLIAFIFLPLSVLNSFLSLKSRYLDWSATNSKRQFNKRLEELKKQLAKIDEYGISPISLFIDVMHELITALFVFFFAFFLLLAGEIILAYGPENQRYVAVLLFFVAQMLLLFSMKTASQITRSLNYIRKPEMLTDKIRRLVERGVIKGLTSISNHKVINSVVQKEK